jgi:predicted nuclease of predicted toxin-antitoxin system
VRLLLDNNLSPRLGDVLMKEGWDVAHVASLGLRSASDRVVLQAARDDDRVLVSADTDFGTLLAASHEPGRR